MTATKGERRSRLSRRPKTAAPVAPAPAPTPTAADAPEGDAKRNLLDVFLGRGNQETPNPWEPLPERYHYIELDGRHALVVTQERGQFVDYRTTAGASPEAALATALEDINRRDPVLVAVAGQYVQARRIAEFPRVPDRALSGAIAAKATQFASLGVLASAGRVIETTEGRAAVVAAVDNARVAPLWALSNRPGEFAITAAPLRLVVDGVHLAMRYGAAEVTWVVDGNVMYHRAMSVGGLDSLYDQLDNAAGPGSARVETVLRNMAQGDMDAVATVESYVADAVSEARQTLNQWATQAKMPAPERIAVFGPGAILPTLPSRLVAAGFKPEPPPLPPGVSFDSLPEPTRLAAWSPAAGARVPVRGLWELFINEAAAAATAARQQAARRATNIARGVIALVLLVLMAVVPVLAADWTRASARADLKEANDQLAPMQPWLDAAAAVQGRIGTVSSISEPVWQDIMRTLYNALPDLPDGSSVTNFSASVGADSITIKIEAAVPDRSGQEVRFAKVAIWARNVADALGAVPNIPNFSHAGNADRVNLELTLPFSDARWYLPRVGATTTTTTPGVQQ
ncbi:MAG TPA: hypothetical protein VHD87_15350 [Acidimicrobiales bacterium]|nr:hypothetical protein [Acidimicrobiales bacterium]